MGFVSGLINESFTIVFYGFFLFGVELYRIKIFIDVIGVFRS